MNKKLIMGLAIGICAIAIIMFIVANIVHLAKQNDDIPEDTSSQVSSEVIDEPNTSEIIEVKPVESEIESTEPENSETTQPIESDVIPQIEEWLPALTEDQIKVIGNNDVLHDKLWLNNMHKANYAYTSRHTPGDIQSISIYYLDDAKVAYFIINTTTNKTYIISSETRIYEAINSSTIDYFVTLSKVDYDRLAERGFKLIYTIDENHHQEIIDFFNDSQGYVSKDNEYKEFYNLTINDLL